MKTNNRVLILRKYLGLTQESFAEKIGVNRATITSIEINKNPLTETNLKLICFIFGVNEQWLRTGEGEMFQKNKSLLETEVLEMFRRLSDEAQIIIRDYIRMVLKQQEALQSRHTAQEASQETPGIGPRIDDGQAG